MRAPVFILLVEDNQDDADLTLRALRKSDSAPEVTTVRDGEEALEYLLPAEPAGEGGPKPLPRVVLLDINLPKLNGFEVLRQLRTHDRTRRLPVVMLTSSNEESDLGSSYDLGANSYIRKPVDYAEFMDVAQCLSRYWLDVNQPAPEKAGVGDVD